MKPIYFKYICRSCSRMESVEARVTEQLENSAPVPPQLWEFCDGEWWCAGCSRNKIYRPIEGTVIPG